MMFDTITIDFYADISILDSTGRCISDNYKHVTFIKNWYKTNIGHEYDFTMEYIIPTDKFIFTLKIEDDGRNLDEVIDTILNPKNYVKIPYRYLILNGRLCECEGILANTMDID